MDKILFICEGPETERKFCNLIKFKNKKNGWFFDNETEHGKLYINYPMIESFKHFKKIPDKDFKKYNKTKFR